MSNDRKRWPDGCGSSEYRSWEQMKARCYNVKATSYEQYGGRGIRVCTEWRLSFPTFLRDMGRKPAGRHTLERLDSSRGYEPANCVWATPTAQTRNRSNTRLLTVGGVTLPIAEWAERADIKLVTLRSRLTTLSPEDAIARPVKSCRRVKKVFTQCQRGHVLDDDNLRVDAQGRRTCRKCRLLNLKESRRRQAENRT